jgi:serine/threonine protein kinase
VISSLLCNIKDQKIRLIDFGFAKKYDALESNTVQAGTGTSTYMAPELLL